MRPCRAKTILQRESSMHPVWKLLAGLVLVVWLPVFHGLDSGLESTASARLPQDDKQAKPPTEPYRGPDVPYVATPRAVVEKMLELAEVKKGDVVYDLGC